MGAQGTSEVDFGAFAAPLSYKGHKETEAAITTIIGQAGILAASAVEAWIRAEPAGTVDHSMDEHLVDAAAIKITACNIVAGVGFDIKAECIRGGAYGKYAVHWVWN
jgi:hypothetical protein